MTQVYFRRSNPKEVLVDRCGAVVNDLTEARDCRPTSSTPAWDRFVSSAVATEINSAPAKSTKAVEAMGWTGDMSGAARPGQE